MVFGNRGADSGSGVAFTRDPSTGAAGAFGDFLFDAQGEDVVAGERDTLPAGRRRASGCPTRRTSCSARSTRSSATPATSATSSSPSSRARLWILQTRVGQRSGRAAVRLAVALADEGLITESEAVERVDAEQLEARARPGLRERAGPGRRARPRPGGLAGRGGRRGRADLRAGAGARATTGEDVILVRPTTSPADLPGVLAVAGVVTGRGGRTSHAAVVARGINRPAVCGTGELEIEDGETISVDGDSGIVARGARPCRPPRTIPSWPVSWSGTDAHSG